MFYIFPFLGCDRCNPGSKKNGVCLSTSWPTLSSVLIVAMSLVTFASLWNAMQCNDLLRKEGKTLCVRVYFTLNVFFINIFFHKLSLGLCLQKHESWTYLSDFQRSALSTFCQNFSMDANSFSSCSISQNGALGSNWTFLFLSIWVVVVVVTISSPGRIHFDVAVVV